MDVLQVNKLYDAVGGVEAVVRALAEGLSDRHGMEVLAARADGRSRRVDGVEVIGVRSFGEVLSVPVAPGFPSALAREAPRVDLLHYHLPNPLGVIAHLLVRPSTPYVVTYHSDIVRQARTGWLYRPLQRRFLGGAERIVATSPRLLTHSDALTDLGVETAVVPLSVDLDDPAYGGPPDTDRDDDPPTVLAVGRLNYYKGIDHLLDAIADLDARGVPPLLVVVGDGPRRAALERHARELGIVDRVSFEGHVDDGTLHGHYRHADVFVLPSVERSEAFGIVQIEAMAHRLPVVNTDLPSGVPWVSPDGETGVTVPPGDAGALADALAGLLADPDRRRRLGENGRDRVERLFSRDRMLDAYDELYRSVESSTRSR
jgi:rhamnosyl/mannosyltransferase